MNKEGHYSFDHVVFKKRDISFETWAELIQNNFENEFYISETEKVKYPGIFRDVINTSEELSYERDRLRPNGLITMALAPELFTPKHALAYLKNI